MLTAVGSIWMLGCADNGESGLDDTSWILTGWSVSSLYPGDFEITASFSEGRISGKAAVNTYGGTYEAGAGDGGRGSFMTGPLSRTKMAGPEPAMRAEDLYFQLLSQARQYAVGDDGLTLFDENGNELLIFARVGQAEL
jgi:heat shock protein HslJ